MSAVPEPKHKAVSWKEILGIFAAIAGVLALPLTFWIANRQQPIKRLTYQVLSYGPLANVSDSVNGRLKVSFDGKPVPDANLVMLRLTNDGNQPVLAEDFKTPFTLHFGNDPKATVLDTDVPERTPVDIVPTLTRRGNTVMLHPLLLNSGDSITLKILLAGGDQKYTGTGRIVGTQLVRQDSLQPAMAQAAIPVNVVVYAVIAYISLIYMCYKAGGYQMSRKLSKKADIKQQKQISNLPEVEPAAEEIDLNTPIAPMVQGTPSGQAQDQRVLQNGVKP